MFGMFSSERPKRSKAQRVRSLASKVAKLEKKKALAAEEKKLKSRLNALRRMK